MKSMSFFLTRRNCLFILLALVTAVSLGCTRKDEARLGTPANPFKLYFIPAVDTNAIATSADEIISFIKQQTGYEVKGGIPTSYIAVIEALGSKQADAASLNTFGYILANKKYGVQARLRYIQGESDLTYRAQVIVRGDRGYHKLEDLRGKKFAFVDPASTAGYLLPFKMFKDRGIELGETVFAQRHDSVVTMVYQGQVDGGATYWSAAGPDGKIRDARNRVLTQYPDVAEKVKILELSEEVPNAPFVFRKDVPEEMARKVTEALVAFSKTEHGKEVLKSVFDIGGFVPATDADYNVVREMLVKLGKDAEELL
ncbi:MAG: phosphate/phosphite/phosphonate ABC transporter substrate-binding protein [Deltaproteobacteria bacterium]|nr:phosphate/phosphite/phosphonate ABC transporter substrate-binding protein [Deltaproteobacteria bacterium]